MWIYFCGRQYGECGRKSYILSPLHLTGTKHIFWGDEVEIWKNARIEAVEEYNADIFFPEINIGNRVKINQDCHITCGSRIEIADDVVCAARVTITDITHEIDDGCENIVSKGKILTKPVQIGRSCFIGNNAVILSSVSIGEFAVIGANSVVTKDVPAYAVVYGNPAIVSRYRKEDR